MGAGSSGKGRICLRSSGGCMIGGCRSRGRGPARLKLPKGQRKHYVGAGRLTLGSPTQAWQSQSPAGAPKLRSATDPHHTHFPLLTGSGAMEQGALWAWGRVQICGSSLRGDFHFPLLQPPSAKTFRHFTNPGRSQALSAGCLTDQQDWESQTPGHSLLPVLLSPRGSQRLTPGRTVR